MNAELISVGTEILLGNIINTNAAYLSRQCAGLGLSVYHQVTVGDNKERLLEVLNEALSRSDVILMTGGLGPTQDDLTKETVAEALGLAMVTDVRSEERIKAYFEKKGLKEIPINNYKQAKVIDGSMVLDNDHGTAPGLIVVTKDNKRIILLPGPGQEMIPMFERFVCPYLKSFQEDTIFSKIVKLCGISESVVETKLLDLIEAQENPTIATYAKQGEVHIRLTAKAASEEEAKKLIKPVFKEIKARLKENIYSTNEDDTLEDVVVHLLQKYDLTITTAESCTGGMVTSRIVNVPGASDVLKEGFVTYSNKAKKKYLDVNKLTLKKYGAVSEQTAKEMAKGVAITTDCDAALSITGIAGPDGGTEEKPAGTVFIGCYINGKTVVKKHCFAGNRLKVRELATISALDLLRRCILENYK